MFRGKICTVEMLEFLCKFSNMSWSPLYVIDIISQPEQLGMTQLVIYLRWCVHFITAVSSSPTESLEIQGKPNLLWFRKYDYMRVQEDLELFVV